MTDIIMSKGLVVSCQALAGEPLYGSEYMVAMAKAAEMKGAIGIRANGEDDISAIKREVNLPLIGLNKRQDPEFEVYITPTIDDAFKVYHAGADIVAIDGTDRPRMDGHTLEETIRTLKENNIHVMADISTLEEGMKAAAYGADYVSTTLSGYTPYSKQGMEPNFKLVSQLVNKLSIPVVAEGHITSPEQAVKALKIGASFVVVGSAITRPQCIVAQFTSQINEYFDQARY